MCSDGRIPNVAKALFSVRAISRHLVRSSWQQVRIIRIKRLPCFALSDSSDADIHIAIRALTIVCGTALPVVDDLALFLEIKRSRSGRPLPAIHAAVAGVIEIVEVY